MSTNFPSALDTFTNPNGSDSLNAAAVPHAEQHANANDAIEALQAKVGINGSAVATSLDYRISAAETGLGGKISSSEKGSANGVATLGFDGKVPSSQLPPLDYIPTSEKGVPGGVAGLDEAGKVPAAQLPSYVDDVLEYANLAAFPVTGEAGKIYVALDTNKTYRWSGSTYIYITSGAVDSVAGKTGVVVLTKADVGLANVDNTSDADKPISTAQQTALNAKESTITTGTTEQYYRGDKSWRDFAADVRSAALTGLSTATNAVITAADTVLGSLGKLQKQISDNLSALTTHTDSTANPHSVTKAQVGLGNVDNTSDADKPVSTAQQSALGLKLNTSGGTITANSTDPALKITQTGAGNALVVEDAASPDTTPFVVAADGAVGIGTASPEFGGLTVAKTGDYALVLKGNDFVTAQIRSYRESSSDHAQVTAFAARGTEAAPTILASGDRVLSIKSSGWDGTGWISTAQIRTEIDGTPAAGSMPGRLTFSTTPSGSANPVERMRINSVGNVAIGGSPTYGFSLLTTKNITGAANSASIVAKGEIQSDCTAYGAGVLSLTSVADAPFTLPDWYHFRAVQGVKGASATVTRQYGFHVGASFTAATNNYGFFSDIASGTGRWNFYASGTADNYFAGNVTANAAFNQTPTRSTVASGSTVTLTTGTNHLLYDQAATVAALTVTLPSASLTDGQVITIATRSAITALTVNGGTIYGAPITLAAGGFCSFIYSSSAAAWFRKG